MKELKQQLDNVYGYAAKIPVTGDSVEWMALVRQGLREAYAMLEKMEKEGADADDHGNTP